MERQLPQSNGNGAPHLREQAPARAEPTLRSQGDSLVEVARDAIDAAKTMVQDGMSLATLEARRAARNVGPKLVWGLVATVFGVVGGLLAIIALFLAAEVLIPSVAGRLALFATAFLVIASFAALQMRPAEAQAPAEPVAPRITKGIAPMHPVDGVGE